MSAFCSRREYYDGQPGKYAGTVKSYDLGFLHEYRDGKSAGKFVGVLNIFPKLFHTYKDFWDHLYLPCAELFILFLRHSELKNFDISDYIYSYIRKQSMYSAS